VNACRPVSRALAAGGSLPPEAEQHLFVCPRCRRRARSERVGREIDAIGAPAVPEAAVPADFAARVMRGLPRRRGGVPPAWKWAAALAVFSAAVGYGYTVWSEAISAGQEVAATSPAPVEETALLAY
jgi:predicted anti-sigma-YlaC factor YlaD